MPRLRLPRVRAAADLRRATALLLLGAAPGAAQSLIVGIPSTDVTQRGRTIAAHESQFSSTAVQRGWTSFTFVTHGIGHRTELAASLLNVSAPSSENRALSVGFKSAVPLGGDEPASAIGPLRRVARRVDAVAAGGAMVLQSLDRRGTGLWLHATASIRLPWRDVRRRTRVTVGPSWGTRQQFGRTATSLMLGVEQPVTEHVALVADWYSGDHDLAATITAIQVRGPDDLLLITGWKTPNTGVPGGKPAFMFEVAKEF
jgi:hypothetical protein